MNYENKEAKKKHYYDNLFNENVKYSGDTLWKHLNGLWRAVVKYPISGIINK